MRCAVAVFLVLPLASCTVTNIEYPEGPNGERQGFLWAHEDDTPSGRLLPFDLDEDACHEQKNLEEEIVDAVFFDQQWDELFVEPALCEGETPKELPLCAPGADGCSELLPTALLRASSGGWSERAISHTLPVAAATCDPFREVGRIAFPGLLLADMSVNGRTFVLGGEVDTGDVLYRWSEGELVEIELPSSAQLRAAALDLEGVLWIVDDRLRRTADRTHRRWDPAFVYDFPDEQGDWHMAVAGDKVIVATPTNRLNLTVTGSTSVRAGAPEVDGTRRLVRRGGRIGRLSPSGRGEIFEPAPVQVCSRPPEVNRFDVRFDSTADYLAFGSEMRGPESVFGASREELLVPDACSTWKSTPAVDVTDIVGFRDRLLVLMRSDAGRLTLATFDASREGREVYCPADLGVEGCLGARALTDGEQVFIVCTKVNTVVALELDADD